MYFDSTKIQEAFSTLLGWRAHFDTNEIDLPAPLLVSDSGEFYQDKHSALRLDLIQACLPPNYSLNTYLGDVVKGASAQVVNDLLEYRNLKRHGKTILDRKMLLNGYGNAADAITNESKFVGLQIRVRNVDGLAAIINQIGVQFTAAQEDLKLYLFHSSKKEPIETFLVTTTDGPYWDWVGVSKTLNAQNLDYTGGVFVLGYYQDDLTGQAINYRDFNWDKGVCSTCNPSLKGIWEAIQANYLVYPLYVDSANFVVDEMFDLNNAVFVNDTSWGLNLKLTTVCDLTDFLIANKTAFKNALALKVVWRILGDMRNTTEVNAIEENLKHLIIRDLEGDVETKATNLPTQYFKAIKSVNYNISNLNSRCLDNDNNTPDYGVL